MLRFIQLVRPHVSPVDDATPTSLQSASWCETEAQDVFRASLDTAEEICAIDAPSDSAGTCEGDSGGPLVALDPSGAIVEIGITSSGSCNPANAGFFQRIDVISTWLAGEITALSPPGTTTGSATAVGLSSATLAGQVNSNNNETSYDFQYGATSSYGATTPAQITNGNAALPVSATLKGLTPGTTYHYRLLATNANGTSYGADATFTTIPPPAPTPTTQRIGGIGETTAILNGRVNPNGYATSYEFQYGTTTSYGANMTTQRTDDGSTVRSVSTTLKKLAPGATYHYRLVATNANGTSDSADGTFTTRPAPISGTYRGRTTQKERFSVKVASNRTQITALSFGFDLRCAKHPRLVRYTFSPKGSYYWPRRLRGDVAFTDTFTDANRWRYAFTATFTTTGAVSGTMSVRGNSRPYGSCTSGIVHWSAKA